MGEVILLKRSAVPAKTPSTGDLNLGEMAINTHDGDLFIKKDNGTASIIKFVNFQHVSTDSTFASNSSTLVPSQSAVKTAIDNKQDVLVSGTNIKTINGNDILGSGNLNLNVSKVAQIITGNIPQTTGTTILPYDTTAPTNTEGFEIFSTTITPTYNNSNIVVIFNVYAECSANTNTIVMSLYKDTTSISVVAARPGAANASICLGITKNFVSGTTAPITLSARVGPNAASTVYLNRGNTETMGLLTTSYIIMEIV